MKMIFIPKTHAGKWSVNLFIAFIALYIAAVMIFLILGNTAGYTNLFSNPLLWTVIYYNLKGNEFYG